LKFILEMIIIIQDYLRVGNTIGKVGCTFTGQGIMMLNYEGL